MLKQLQNSGASYETTGAAQRDVASNGIPRKVWWAGPLPPRRGPCSRRPCSSRHQRTCQRGVAAIEFAFIAPMLLALIFGAVEYGRYAWIQDTMQHGVEDAARYGVFQFNLGNAQWQSKTSAYASDKMYGLANLTVTVSPTALVKNGISVIEVTASYPFQPIIPPFSMAIAGTMTAVVPQPTGS